MGRLLRRIRHCARRHGIRVGLRRQRSARFCIFAPTTFDARGNVESGTVRVQLKATDSLVRDSEGREILQRVAVSDLKTWLYEINPVLLVVYDAQADRAYWLNVQDYVRVQKVEWEDVRSITMRIPTTQLLTVEAVREIRVAKNRQVAQTNEHRGQS